MGLDERVKDGNVLKRFDRFMINVVGNIGRFYQYTTGRSHADIVKASYKISGVGMIGSFLGGNIFALPCGAYAYSMSSKPEIETSFEEEVRLMSYLRNPDTNKAIRACILCATPALVYMMGTEIVSDEGGSTTKALSDSFLAGGYLAYTFAEYLSKAEIPKKPSRTLLDDLKRLYLMPKPSFG